MAWVPPASHGQDGQAPATELKDQYGDPLPAGALARLGTVRWRHGGVTGFVAFLPDGKSVISAADDNLIRVWEYPSGKEIRHLGPGLRIDPNNGFGRAVYYGQSGLPVAVTPDGKTAACSFEGGDIKLYEVATGKELPSLKNGNNFRGFPGGGAMEFSPDGQHLAVLEYDSSIRIWDWANAKEVRHFNVPQLNNTIFGGNPSLAYSPDGKMLATVNLELANNMVVYSIKMWDAAEGKEIRSIALPQNAGGASPVFSPDSKTLAFSSFDGNINLIEVATGKEIRKIPQPGRGMVSISFSRSGKTLFTRGYNDAGLREVDIETAKELRQLGTQANMYRNRFGYSMNMSRPVYSPDGAVLAVAGQGHSLRFLDVESGKEVHSNEGHASPIQTIHFAAGGKTVWTSGDEATIRQWDSRTGQELKPIAMPNNALTASMSRDGSYVVTQPMGIKGIQIVDVATGKAVGTIQPPERAFYGNVALAPDSSTVAVRFQQVANRIDLYDMPAYKARPGLFGYVSAGPALFTRYAHTPPKLRRSFGIDTGYPEPGAVVGAPITPAPATMIFSPDSRKLAAYSDPNTLAVWDTATGRKLLTLPVGNKVQIQSGAFSLDGRCLALDMNDGTVVLWELASSKQRHVYGKKPPPDPNANMMRGGFVSYGGPPAVSGDKIAFSPGGKQMAHAGYDRLVHVWDVATGAEVAALRGHTGTINGVAFAPDGKTLASASSDTTALIWDMNAVQPKLVKRPLPANEVEARWQLLKDGDAQKAFAAICDLAASPEEAVAFLKGQIQPAPTIDMALVTKMIANLDDATYRVRQKATVDLLKVGERAVPPIDKALAAGPPLEVKKRLEDVRDKLISTVLTDEKLRLYRAIEVLEQIGTPEALQLLQTLAGGAPGAFETTSADAALTRMRQ
jgi:WD40 repeat protein